MMLPSTFLPAQTLLLLNEHRVKAKELLKLTFVDLLIRQMIELEEEDHPTVYKYVRKGKNFGSRATLPFEDVYLSPYYKSASIRIFVQHLIRMGFQNAKSERKYRSFVTRSKKLEPYVTISMWQYVFGGFSVSYQGWEMKKMLEKEIADLERLLPSLISSDKERALEIIQAIGGNVFLLKNVDITMLKVVDENLFNGIDLGSISDSSSGDSCSGCSYWSGCLGCHSSHSSGCSGDSGCSGCGGDIGDLGD